MDNTPILTNEFHPVPKVYKDKKPPSKIGPGKKTISSLEAVDLFKKQFFAWGITSCEWKHEKCWKTNALTFAHKDKRRFLTKEDIKDPKMVALICTPGHIELEQMPREEMRKIIDGIVAARQLEL